MLFERQKSLLALVDALGGEVAGVDLQKLLFLWNHELGDQAYYDFVPYKFGAFSHTSYADRRKLVAKGLLADDENHWAVTTEGRTALAPSAALRREAADFVARAPRLRGDALVAATYRAHPFFAIRSEIAERVLDGESRALAAVEEARPLPGQPGIVTIGYEGRSLERYLVQLIQDGVTLLCDVRRNPLSRRYGFSRSTLSKACEGVDLRYEHLPELGIASDDRRGLVTQTDYDALFEVYESEALPQQCDALARIAGWVRAGERVALTCYEKLPQQCHRHCVADALERNFGASLSPVHM